MYWITGILGLALIAAPYVLGYATNPTAVWTSLILGVAVVIVSAYKAFAHDMAKWEYWVAGLLGLAAIVLPFVLGFSTQASAMLILGAAVAILAGYQVFFVKPSEKHEMR